MSDASTGPALVAGRDAPAAGARGGPTKPTATPSARSRCSSSWRSRSSSTRPPAAPCPRSGPSAGASSLGTEWDPVADRYGALPYVFGTAVSSALAMLLAVPLGLGTAIYLAELAPRRVDQAVSFVVELLASIPSIVYGIWGLFVLAPVAAHRRRALADPAPRVPAPVPGLPLRHRHAQRRHRARDHGGAHHHLAVPRDPARHAALAARGRAGAGRDPGRGHRGGRWTPRGPASWAR